MNPFILNPKDSFVYDKILCNSQFTKLELQKYTNKKIQVIYPPIEIDKIKPNKNKKNYIVTVGRISKEKKHEIMIDAFKILEPKGWELHIIGSFQDNNSAYDKSYFNMIKEKAKGLEIYFHINIPHNQVLDFLGKSKIYWHARGYGETDPVEYENFGITTVEAMASGCTPIVINLGAQPEIVEQKKNGYCWNKVEELLRYTKKVMKYTTDIDYKAIKKAKNYSKKRFINEILDIILN